MFGSRLDQGFGIGKLESGLECNWDLFLPSPSFPYGLVLELKFVIPLLSLIGVLKFLGLAM